ncbi:MAG TPA: hypothetical protein VHS80_00150 [Chthoniobacterales bacterium]|jgi:hypothetical protein|nr:hypothetical protein [Chthoniobacterales bacterium]
MGPISEALGNSEGQKQLNESLQTYQEIERSSDRVCAIVAAAWLETRLRHAIDWRLLHDLSEKKKVFDPNGMLGTYERKVSLGYLLGIFRREAKDNFLAIGSIRNRFAHRTYIRCFEHRELDSFFKKITFYKRLKEADTKLQLVLPAPIPENAGCRARFIASAMALDAFLVLDPFDHSPITSYEPRF